MSELRQKMIRAMELKNLSPHPQRHIRLPPPGWPDTIGNRRLAISKEEQTSGRFKCVASEHQLRCRHQASRFHSIPFSLCAMSDFRRGRRSSAAWP